jgi:hypothetical protein
MTTPAAPYSESELAALRLAVIAGRPPVCPQDSAVMVRRAIGGGSFGLGYARRREWLICPTCKRSAIFDVARGTRT